MDYGFSEHLSSLFPSQVMVDLTEVCNLACKHCPHPTFKQSSFYNRKMLDDQLNMKMVSEVANYGANITNYIRYTGNGEPLVHPKSYDMIQYAVDNSLTKVTLTTNGTLLNSKRINKLIETGLHLIDVSIDAYNNDTYKKIRVNGDLDITRRNVLEFIKIARSNNNKTKVVVSFVEQKENSHEINEFHKFWTANGAHKVIIRKLHSNSGSLILENNNFKIKRFPCLYPWERVVLNARGYLSFCPTDWYGKSEIEHYSKTTIKSLWKDNFYNDLRDQHLNNNFKNQFCKQCPDWKNTCWPQSNKKERYNDVVDELLR